MLIETTLKNNEITLRLPAEFNHKMQREFRGIYENHPPTTRYIIDFNALKMIDSSTIGMLLLLREYCGEDKSAISFVGCNPTIREILQSAHFEKLFNIP